MNRLVLVLVLALASFATAACTAPSSEEGEEQAPSSEEARSEEEHLGQSQEKLSCNRFPKDSCVTLQTYCNRHGGQLWCNLQGFCTCRFPAAQLYAP